MISEKLFLSVYIASLLFGIFAIDALLSVGSVALASVFIGLGFLMIFSSVSALFMLLVDPFRTTE